jgi:hypothetical protein
MTMKDGHATGYVCRNFTCREPVTSADAMLAQLGDDEPPPAEEG